MRESLLHTAMGIQVGIPILVSILFSVNVTVLLICFAAVLLHEFVAHYDVHYATPRRHISIWEVHVHNYMATIPLYLLMLIIVINWDMFINLITFNWAGHMQLQRVVNPHAGATYLPAYLTFMAITCVVPYAEENLRCLRVYLKQKKASA